MNDAFELSIDEKIALTKWHDALDFYAHDWDKTFDYRGTYYTQEFWYLLVDCAIHYWRGEPLTVGNACERMKAGSKRTRDERIKKAEIDGLLERHKHTCDRRETFLIPSNKLQQKIHGHLLRTLQNTIIALSEINVSALPPQK
ncbi:hypothetical protein [Brumicola pallidula]|uniref:Uncharacterized protein n=1 Tax=Brumicola pallidula DSM 14239 = ACAM 615 TaxID=1121922 RepID=K6YU23_9ALTE|nr:hypothetical protein [Glaciecola pallidula]GAC27456.1 hypothetical protein GPAL_0576 [Glaciecola pallidula DSM 14239 = ACAM 615]